MAERASLVAAISVGLVLAALVVADRCGAQPSAESRLVPGVGQGALERLRIELAGGEHHEIEWRGAEASLTAPIEVPVDPDAARALAGTLEYLAPVRSEPRAAEHGLDPPRARLIARVGGKTIALAVGAEVVGQDRVWLGKDGDPRAHLVDGHQLRTLLAPVDQLRARRPLVGRPLGDLRLVGSGHAEVELRNDRVHVVGVWWDLDRGAFAELRADLDAIELVAFEPSSSAPSDEPGLAIYTATNRAEKAPLMAYGPCPGHPATTRVVTPIGDGCVADAALAAIDRWAREPWRLIRRSPFAMEPSQVESVAFALKDVGLHAGASVDARTAEPIRQFVVAMTTALGPPVTLADARIVGSVDLTGQVDGKGTFEAVLLFRLPDGGLAFAEPSDAFGFRLEPRAVQLLSPMALLPLDLIEREPSDVVAIELSRHGRVVGALRRGELLEEWIATGNTEDVDGGAVATAMARLRAAAWVAPRAEPSHGLVGDRIAIELAPEEGVDAAALRHTLELGADAPEGGCYGRLDDAAAVFRLEATRCAQLRPLVASP